MNEKNERRIVLSCGLVIGQRRSESNLGMSEVCFTTLNGDVVAHFVFGQAPDPSTAWGSYLSSTCTSIVEPNVRVEVIRDLVGSVWYAIENTASQMSWSSGVLDDGQLALDLDCLDLSWNT